MTDGGQVAKHMKKLGKETNTAMFYMNYLPKFGNRPLEEMYSCCKTDRFDGQDIDLFVCAIWEILMLKKKDV